MSGQIIKADIDGVEQSFEVLGSLSRNPRIQATHYLSYKGELKTTPLGDLGSDVMRLRLLRKRHTFGLNVYEEDGIRPGVRGETVLEMLAGNGSYTPAYVFVEETPRSYTILKPIGTISEDGKTLWKNDGTNEPVKSEND